MNPSSGLLQPKIKMEILVDEKHLFTQKPKSKIMTKYAATGLLIILFTVPLYAQKDQYENHPIDVRREECHGIDSNQTTYGMIHCEDIAREEWESEMNAYYGLLMQSLTMEGKEKLEIAQKNWRDFRERELDFSGTMYYSMDGTMWKVVAAIRSCDIVKARARELKDYYEILTTDGDRKSD